MIDEDTLSKVAPELRAGLDYIPSFDFTPEFIAYLRTGGPIATSFPRPPLTPEQESVRCEERQIPGLDGAPAVRVLIYSPPAPATQSRPGLLHIHGGGFILGNPEINDGANRSLVAALGCVVASVDYRLAPETRFPGPIDDCYAALQWLHASADELVIDPTRIAIAGESAGGGHAAALAIRARDLGGPPVCFQLLDSPMLDDRTGSAFDSTPDRLGVTWTASNNRFGWSSLLGCEPGGGDTPINASPARVADLSGLPPAYILVGGLDLFVEECVEYARRLMVAGVATELHVIPGAYHAFGIAGPDAPQVQCATELSRAALARGWRSTETAHDDLTKPR